MKPITLKMKAFGPYLDEQYIDFSDFYASNLFLIHGETGSGKTTILDAITYSLYGKSSGGGRGDISQMRCARADNKTDTLVEYEFSVRDVVYKFTRSIRCTSGGKLQISQNALINRNGVYEQLGENDNQTTVNNEAERVIGLNYEQFRQVIILPQGQFENFLVAKSDVKETILNTLFNAERWSKITGRLWDKAREMDQSLKLQESRIDNTLKEYDCDSIEMFRELIANFETLAEIAEDNVTSLTKVQFAAQDQLEHSKNINNKFKELKDYQSKFNNLILNESDIDSKRKQYSDAITALKVKPVYLAYLDSEIKHKQRSDNVRNTTAQYNNALRKCDDCKLEVEKIERYKEQYDINSTMLIKYNAMIDLYKNFEVRKREAIDIRYEYYNMQKIADNDAAQLQHDIDLRKQLADNRDYIISQYSAALPQLRHKVEELNKSRKLIIDSEKIKNNIKDCTDRLADKNSLLEINNDTLAQLRNEYQDKYSKYISNTAALLAENIKDDMPCPVCGSTHHPSPHVNNESENITTEQLKSLNDKITKIADNINLIVTDIEVINIKLHTLNDTLQELEANIKDSVPFTQVAVTEAESKLTQAETECAKLDSISLELKSLDENITRLNELTESYKSKTEELKNNFDMAMADCKAIKQQMDDTIPDSNALMDRISNVTDYITRYETALDKAKKNHTDAASLLDRCEENLKTANLEMQNAETELSDNKTKYSAILSESGFADTEVFKRALDNSQHSEKLDYEIKEYDKLHYSLSESIKLLEESLKGETPYDTEELTEKYNKITSELNDCISKQGIYKNTVVSYKKILKDLEARSADLVGKRERYEKLNSFATSLNGIRGIGLSRYVLGVMLSAVIHQANILLQNVHNGRYSLRHTLDAHGRSHKSGLEIEVYDSYTDKTRWAATLSGGEKFLIALTLSLGLSSVVQSQSGGIKMDAIFIDEGFGTLDPYSIEDALNILQDINVSRSMVGIISHVGLLKDNIESAIEVEKNRNGSSLHFNKIYF